VKILIADDDLVSRTMLAGILTGWGYEMTVARDGKEAWRILQAEEAPTLAILDWVMPGLTGKQLCQMVRSRQTDRYTYVLLVTAKSGHEDIINGLEAGADDYLIKPYNPLELKARLITGRRILDMQEQLFATQEALRQQATTDALTGAWNHRAIMDILEREVSRSQREGRPLGVVLGDLDHFKRINDTYGHMGGDEALREAAQRMRTAVRPYDFVGRYGGEEFLIVLPGCDYANAIRSAERIREHIASKPACYQKQSIAFTASFGIVAYAPPRPIEWHSLLQNADAALYQAKNGGRNRVEGYDAIAAWQTADA